MAELKFDDLNESEKLLKNKYLVFSLGTDEYCIKLYHIKEILGMLPHTPVPNTPEYLKGVINVRGQIVPVMDVRLRFGMPEGTYNDRTCIIIVEHEKGEVGMIVDVVSEVFSIDDDQIMWRKNEGSSDNDFIKGIINMDNKIIYVVAFNRMICDN